MTDGDYVDIDECPRCNNFHDHLEVSEIDPPETIDGEECRWWATCPMTDEPIFLKGDDE